MHTMLYKQILTKLSINISSQVFSPSSIPYSPFSSLYLLPPSLPPISPLSFLSHPSFPHYSDSLPPFLSSSLPLPPNLSPPPSHPLFPSIPSTPFLQLVSGNPEPVTHPYKTSDLGGNLSIPTTGLALAPTGTCPTQRAAETATQPKGGREEGGEGYGGGGRKVN